MQIIDGGNGSQFLNLTYNRDGASQVIADNSTTYGYDRVNRLTTAKTGGSATSYGYDNGDNLININGANSTSQIFDAANQLQTATTMNGSTLIQKYTFAYDPNGNRASRTDKNNVVTSYGWDQANRLTSFGSSATYAYNGDGLRMSKTVSGTTTQFVWDLAEGLALTISAGAVSYVTGSDGLPLEQISGTTVSYFHRDQLGSTRTLTNSLGQVANTYTYDAYGSIASQSGSTPNLLLFQGQYQDSESGLYYLRARYYEPSSSQFLARDPALMQTREPYAYVSGNPLNATDPAGLCSGFDPGCWASSVWTWGTTPRPELQPVSDAAQGVAGYVDLLTAGAYGNGLNAAAGRTVVDKQDCNYQYGRGVGKQIINLGILIRFGGEVFDTENPKTIVGKPGTRVPTPLPEPPRKTRWGLVFELAKSILGNWAGHQH
jgi:RHS repeat-associated protein